MEIKTLGFEIAYESYYNQIQENITPGIEVLEIGGGAHPSIQSRSDINFSIIDPDQSELDKSPEDCNKICTIIEDYMGNEKYDLVISKMVLEHIEEPDNFHKKIMTLLSEGGKAIHFFACRHSIPAFVNRLLPESFGDAILKLLKNRNTEEHPKYPAFYRKTKGHLNSQLDYFQSMGFEVMSYHSFVGHKYFRSIPVLKQIEQLYTWLLVQLKMKMLATVAIVVLTKK